MAAIQTIRKRGVILASVIAIALFCFIAGDLFRGCQSMFQSNAQVIGKVNDSELKYHEYNQMVEEYQTFLKVAQNQQSLGDEQLNQVRDEVWNEYVQMSLIEKECESLGISVTDKEIAEIVQLGQSQYLQIPIFMANGRYDYAALKNFLDTYQKAKNEGNQLPEEYEQIYMCYMFAQKEIRNQLLAQKYSSLMMHAVTSNNLEAKLMFDGRATQSDIVLASLPASSIKDDAVTVSEADIKQRYNERKSYYAQFVETRDIKIVDWQIQPSQADKEAAQQYIAECATNLESATSAKKVANAVRQANSDLGYYDIYKSKTAFPAYISSQLDSVAVGSVSKGEFDPNYNVYYTFKVIDSKQLPDSVCYRGIAVVGNDEKETASKSDSIVNALKNGGSFADIAKKYGQPSDSTWMTSAMVDVATTFEAPEVKLISTVFGMTANQVEAIHFDNGATYVVQVLKTANPITKYNVAAIIKPLKFSEETYKNEFNKFASFAASNKTVKDIEANAKTSGYEVQPIEDLMANAHYINGLHGTSSTIKWIFDNAKVGDVSQVYECGNNDHLLLAALTGVNEKGDRPFDKVKEEITTELMKEKKLEALLKKAEAVKSIDDAKKIEGAQVDSIGHVSFGQPIFVSATSDYETVVGSAASKTAVGKVSTPVKGRNGVYVVKVTNQVKTDEQFDALTEKISIARQLSQTISQTSASTLRRSADVTDNRYKF